MALINAEPLIYLLDRETISGAQNGAGNGPRKLRRRYSILYQFHPSFKIGVTGGFPLSSLIPISITRLA